MQYFQYCLYRKNYKRGGDNMCGLNFSTEPSRLWDMNKKIEHRGFRSLISIHDGLGFGHVRLPIQNPSFEFDQPYEYDGKIFLFVGEILNYKDLDPTAESDIVVLAKKWCKEGINAFKSFEGFWSVVIYDKKTQQLHVITDPLAYKPLYFRKKPYFEISSEIKALLHPSEIEYDPLYFSSTAKWGYHFSSNNTFDVNIKKVEPGIYTVFSAPMYNDYDDTLAYSNWYMPLKPQRTDLFEALEKSVKYHTVSDLPIGLLLSGGLDSSIIYHFVRKLTNNITIFHIDNNEEEYLNYLEIPSNTPVVKVSIDEKSYDINKILYYNESPFDLGSMVPQYLLAEEIKKHGINVILSGDGADELFGGYRRMKEYDAQYSDVFQELIYYHIPRLDKLMMSQTIELRCPFLSTDVIQHALSLPYSDRVNKSYLRSIFKNYLPKEICYEEKRPLKYKNPGYAYLEWRYELIKIFKKNLFQL